MSCFPDASVLSPSASSCLHLLGFWLLDGHRWKGQHQALVILCHPMGQLRATGVVSVNINNNSVKVQIHFLVVLGTFQPWPVLARSPADTERIRRSRKFHWSALWKAPDRGCPGSTPWSSSHGQCWLLTDWIIIFLRCKISCRP